MTQPNAKEHPMPRLTHAASILAVLALTTAPAIANSDHHGGEDADAGAKTNQMGVDMHKSMMQMMAQMHADDGMLMMGAGSSAMGMMDRDMMQMMRPMMDASSEGMGNIGNTGAIMQQGMMSHDGDGDDSLNLDEFADWHDQMMRETMVDRFQHLDADGDGKITGAEMQGFAGRTGLMSGMESAQE